jgi:hypothetical protein
MTVNPELSETPNPYIPENGNFTNPSGFTSSYDQGSQMVIQWETPYDAVNLYIIWRGNRSVSLDERQCQINSKGDPFLIAFG